MQGGIFSAAWLHYYIARARLTPTQPSDTKMNRLLRVAPISLILSIAVSTASHGQKSYALGLGGGAAIPVGKLSDVQKTGYNVMAVLAVGRPDLPVGLRFDGIYNNLRRTDPVSGGSVTSSDLRVIAALVNLVYAFPGTSAKTYILAGGGLYNTKPDVPGAKAQNNFGSNAGLGITFGFGPFAAFLESRYHSISRSTKKGGVFQFVPITAGFMF